MKHRVKGLNARVSGPFRLRQHFLSGRLSRNQGFSVIELVVVASLALVVGSIALPRLVQMRNNFNLQGDLRVVQVTIQSARYNAIATGRQYQIVVQAAPIPQMQVQRDNAVNPQDPTHIPVFVNLGAPITFSNGLRLAKGGKIVCDFSGTVKGTGFDLNALGEPFVDMSNKSGRDFSVSVSPLGRVTVVKNS